MKVDRPGLGAPLVERGEVRQRHVDLAAHLDQRRRVVDPQRDRADRAQVVRDVLADLAVAARGAAHEHAVAVEQRHRQPVDLRLGHELERRVLDPLAREVVAHAVDPGPQLLLGARVGEREHRLQVRDLLELADRLPAHALGRRVGREQLRVLALDRRAARPAARRRRRRRSRGRRGRSSGGRGRRAARAARRPAPQSMASSSAASSRWARSKARSASMPCSAVRSKCSGVTAIRPGGDRREVGPRLVVVHRRVAVDAVELAAASPPRSGPAGRGRCACPAARPRRRRSRRPAR